MAAPPLPPGPPPPISHPPGGSGGGGLPGAGCGWPPISDLLLREAHAWAGLLGLHGGVVQAAHALAGEQAEAGASRLAPSADEATAREQAYCAALTSLAAQCDALATEALRLRNLRKARRTADVAAIEAIIRPHAQEALSAGSALASNSALSVQTATTAIRQAMQTTKTQIAQLRALVAAVEQAQTTLRGELRVCVLRPSDADPSGLFAVDAVLAAVYRRSAELTEAALAEALTDLVDGGDGGGGTGASAAPAAAAPPARRYARRLGGERGSVGTR